MARRILEGMQKATVVFHPTNAVREQILRYGLIDPARLVLAPNGVAPEFCVDALPVVLPESVSQAVESGFVLHVGSCIARKRIDVLLNVFAEVSRHFPDLSLVQVGGRWTEDQLKQIDRLSVEPRIVQLPQVDRATIAELYRRSRAVLIPSEAEGFGLPMVEALACGAVVVASDIPVLREVGAEAARYCMVGDITQWVATTSTVISGAEVPPPLDVRLAQAGKFRWENQARIIARTYLGFDAGA
jgi:glycosyltransferase involved in cell wall biosynthesis